MESKEKVTFYPLIDGFPTVMPFFFFFWGGGGHVKKKRFNFIYLFIFLISQYRDNQVVLYHSIFCAKRKRLPQQFQLITDSVDRLLTWEAGSHESVYHTCQVPQFNSPTYTADTISMSSHYFTF